MSSLLLSALVLLPLPGLHTEDPLPVSSSIQEVTVFPGRAMVRRSADLPAGGGSFVIEGLPWSMDPDTVRVRCFGADVVGIETRERMSSAVPSDRVQVLRDRQRALERELQVIQDELTVLGLVEGHLKRLLQLEERSHNEQVAGGQASPQVWAENLLFLSQQLTGNRDAQREAGWQVEEKQRLLRDLRLELGKSESAQGVYLREVVVELLGQGARGAVLDLEYIVSSAGWQPVYDLRTASDARSVDLSYRAQVWQQSGEDWEDVELSLSTARPQLGAQGPEPRPVWLRLIDPASKVGRLAARAPAAAAGDDSLRALGYVDAEGEGQEFLEPAARPFASVQSEGLSVRFRLATRESIESRPQPTTVLVGQAELAVVPEYHAVPSLDTNVWLRGKATNTSAWTLLPGRAAVYFGADFIGHSDLEAVQPKEEFTLHLGPDPALSLERTRIEDLLKRPGVFGSKATRVETWRMRLENHGAAAVRPDGAVVVYLREVLPRTTDDRIKVELERTVPPDSSKTERWRADFEEQGILTWIVEIAQGGQAQVEYQTRISFPEGMKVLR